MIADSRLGHSFNTMFEIALSKLANYFEERDRNRNWPIQGAEATFYNNKDAFYQKCNDFIRC